MRAPSFPGATHCVPTQSRCAGSLCTHLNTASRRSTCSGNAVAIVYIATNWSRFRNSGWKVPLRFKRLRRRASMRLGPIRPGVELWTAGGASFAYSLLRDRRSLSRPSRSVAGFTTAERPLIRASRNHHDGRAQSALTSFPPSVGCAHARSSHVDTHLSLGGQVSTRSRRWHGAGLRFLLSFHCGRIGPLCAEGA